MTTVVWKSPDGWASKDPIWTSGIMVGSSDNTTIVYANLDYVYAAGWRLFRNSNLGGDSLEITPSGGTTQLNNNILVSNYVSEYGLTYSTIAAINSYDQNKVGLYRSIFPSTQATWTSVSGIQNEIGIDIVFPDVPESPRFLIGMSGGGGKVRVLLTSSGSDFIQYNTNWTPMVSGAIVTDLETVRII
jgi:hypothetical protein